MEGVGARLGRTSARYGPATFTGPVRKWLKEWVPVAAPAAAANGATASSTGTDSGSGSSGNNLRLFKWTPANGSNAGGDGDKAATELAPRLRRYVPVRSLEKKCSRFFCRFLVVQSVRIGPGLDP
jgi:hypothetical protein